MCNQTDCIESWAGKELMGESHPQAVPREVREKGREGGKVSWPNLLRWQLGVPAQA